VDVLKTLKEGRLSKVTLEGKGGPDAFRDNSIMAAEGRGMGLLLGRGDEQTG